jgi:hypothetical protein
VGVSGGATVVTGPSDGLLAAGGVTVVAEHRGLQLAGGVNVARELSGVSLAPVNVQRRVRGLQLGVLNIAEEVDGAAVGVLSIAKNGRVQPVSWVGNDGSVHLALKSLAGFAFTQFGAGIDLQDETFTYDAGAGLHWKLSHGFFLEPALHYSGLHSTREASGAPDEHQLHYLGHLGLRLADKLDLFVAAGVRHTVAGGSGSAVGPEARGGIAFF